MFIRRRRGTAPARETGVPHSTLPDRDRHHARATTGHWRVRRVLALYLDSLSAGDVMAKKRYISETEADCNGPCVTTTEERIER